MFEKKLHAENNQRFTAEMLPRFEGSIEEKTRKLINWMNEHIGIKMWTNEEIEAKFAQRGASEILSEGDVGYMNPCSDLTLVAYALMRKNNIEPAFVAEILRQENRPGTRMHFALEFNDESGSVRYFDFVSGGNAILKKGNYVNDRPDVTSIQVIRIKNPIDFGDNIKNVLIKNGFPSDSIDVQKIVDGFKKDNQPDRFDEYKKSSGGSVGLNLEIL